MSVFSSLRVCLAIRNFLCVLLLSGSLNTFAAVETTKNNQWFESFKASNEVFDISKRKQVTGTLRLWSVFKRGAGKKASYFVIGKN